jgi:myosin heavy subunit
VSFTTKLFVVLLVILVIVNAALEIGFVSQTHDYKKRASDFEQQAKAAKDQAQSLKASTQSKIQSISSLNDTLIGKASDLESRLSRLQDEGTEINSQLATREIDLKSARASLDAMVKQTNIDGEERRSLYRQLNDEQQRAGDLRRRSIDQRERINELRGQVEIFQHQATVLQRQVAAREGELKDLREKLALTDVASVDEIDRVAPSERAQPLTPVTEAPITGTVTVVEGDLIEVSVGSASGVQTGMRFSIYRGEEYIGEMEASKVSSDATAGSMFNLVGSVQPGDKITNRL